MSFYDGVQNQLFRRLDAANRRFDEIAKNPEIHDMSALFQASLDMFKASTATSTHTKAKHEMRKTILDGIQ